MTAQIIDLLKENFKPNDNIPRNHDKESQIILEAGASLYIDTLASTNKFPSFIRAENYNENWLIIKHNLTFTDSFEQVDNEFEQKVVSLEFYIKDYLILNKCKEYRKNIKIDKIYFKLKGIPEVEHIEFYFFYQGNDELQPLDNNKLKINTTFDKSKFEGLERYPKYFPSKQELYNGKLLLLINKFNFEKIFLRLNIKIDEIYEKMTNLLNIENSFNLFSGTSPYNTTEKVYRFAKNDYLPYAPFKVATNTYSFDFFHKHDSDDFLKLNKHVQIDENKTTDDIINGLFSKSLGCKFQLSLNKKIETITSAWYTPVISYFDKYGDVRMKIIKIIMENHKKLLIPVTQWIHDSSSEGDFHCVPFPLEKQPLYNITGNDELNEDTTVILTDSLEIVALNKNNFGSNVKWVSFMCHEDMYEQVDFSLLKNVKKIHLLVTNHSGVKLEKACLNSQKLANHLTEEYDLNLNFILLETKYNNETYFYDIDNFSKTLSKYPPKINQKSVKIIESYETFYKICENAKAKKEDDPFWEKINTENETIEEEKAIKEEVEYIPAYQEYILRPMIIKSTITFMYAKSGLGKTNLGLSLAAAIVSGKKPIKGKSWNVRVHSSYDCNKVLYLDFESGRTKTSITNNPFTKTFFTGVSKKFADNLIIDNLRDENINFSQEENHYKLLDKIENAKNIGNKGQEIDLLVIDTFRSFSQNKGDANWTIIHMLLKKILRKNIAILIIDHSTKDKKYMSGNEDKRRASETIIELFRKNEGQTLADPLTLRFEKNREHAISSEIKRTAIKFDDNWQVVGDDLASLSKQELKDAELKDFGDTVNDYKRKKLSAKERYDIVDLGSTAYSDKMKKYKSKFKKK